ncbi:MAG: substrate-binding domain-containing protein [Pseudomonadota bacterium]
MADVAAHLELTKSTVSRALNGYPDIAETTRVRVERAAERMGYRPLVHAQAIRTGRVRSLGLVLQVSGEDGGRPFLDAFIAGMTQAASAENWTVTISTAESAEGALEALARLIDERKADGIILPRTLRRDPRIDLLRSRGVPFILFGRTANPQGCAWYDITGEDAMTGATTRLAALGHRRIAHVPGSPEYAYSELRIGGYQKGLAAAGLPFDPALVGQPALTGQEGERATAALLALDCPPTAITFAVDRAAFGAYSAAKSLGLRIGSELSVIAYDGIPEGAYADPGLTSFAVDSRRAGARLASLLIQRIRGTAPEELRELAPATLIERGSDRPPRLAPEDLARHITSKTNQMSNGRNHHDI